MAVLQMITFELCCDERVKGRYLYFSVDGKDPLVGAARKPKLAERLPVVRDLFSR